VSIGHSRVLGSGPNGTMTEHTDLSVEGQTDDPHITTVCNPGGMNEQATDGPYHRNYVRQSDGQGSSRCSAIRKPVVTSEQVLQKCVYQQYP
jgi:hypothetical protein